MNTSTQHNIGSIIALATSVLPVAASANVNGVSIDRFAHNMPLSCVLHAVAGAAAGAPTAISVAAKLQHSPDAQAWSDYTGAAGMTVQQTAALTAANGEVSLSIDLTSASRFVRGVALVTLTGGTTPAVTICVDIVFGGEQLLPAI